jgi:hypothetical protein
METKTLSVPVEKQFAFLVRIKAAQEGQTVAGFIRSLLEKELKNQINGKDINKNAKR